MLNAKLPPKKTYEVTLYVDDKQVLQKELDMYHYLILKRVKAWCHAKIASGHRAGYSIKEVKVWSSSSSVPTKVVDTKVSMMKLFLDSKKRKALKCLFDDYKSLYKSYPMGSFKSIRLRYQMIKMYNTLQDEFYCTAKISDNSLWQWQDFLKKFDKIGCLLDRLPLIEGLYDNLSKTQDAKERRNISERISKLWKEYSENHYVSAWSLYMKQCDRNRVYEILKLVSNFNMDTQDSCLVDMFKEDFMSASTDKAFASVMIKWNDLVVWSPWKLELYKDSIPLAFNSHWESETNPDFVSFYEEEV